MSQKESFGIMDEGYFVPRTEILDWLNNLLKLSLNKIQQLGSGAVYCQVIDVIHPGKIAINKVNWKAKNDYQFIANLKILQSAFDKIGIKRYVEVQKLAKAKYQDNLQFIQWLKRYYDLNCGDRGSSYMAQERRGNAQTDFSFADKNVVPKSYNGAGQIIPKNEKTQNFQKKKQPNNNIVSAVAAYRNQNKSKQRKKQNMVYNSNSNSKKQGQAKQSKDKEKIKDLESKLGMIRQIAESAESAETRMKLIEEVLSINTNTNSNTGKEEKEEKMEEEEEILS